jgi:hypothetical protein
LEFNKTFRETIGLEIEKRAVGIYSGMRDVRDWTLRRRRPPPNGKSDYTQSRSRKYGSTDHSG